MRLADAPELHIKVWRICCENLVTYFYNCHVGRLRWPGLHIPEGVNLHIHIHEYEHGSS